MQRPAPQLSRRTALGRLSALGCLAAAPALAQSDDELLGYAPRARPPEGYPAAYAVTVRAAEDEGQLSIHSTTDERVAMPLVADFRRLYPRIAVTYEDLGSTELYHRFIAENQLGREAADVLWSSAMDHMVALATAARARRRGATDLHLGRIFPWFILWFLVASGVRTAGWLPATLLAPLHALAEFLIVVALTAIGLSADLRKMVATGPKPILLGLGVWAAVAVSSLLVQRAIGRW